jgi:endonuclease IV
MTTKKAFKHLTSQKVWYKLCDINYGTARSLKRHFNNGKISEEKMCELLKKAGYKNIPAIWSCK